MPATTQILGETRRTRCSSLGTITAGRPEHFAEIFQDAVLDDSRSIGAFAESLGWTSQACYHYREGKTSPAYDRLLKAIRANRIPPALHLSLLLLLADGKFTVQPVPAVEDLTPNDQARRLRQLVREQQQESLKLGTSIDTALESGRVTSDDLAAVTTSANETHRNATLIQTLIAALFRRGRGNR